jgi:flagellar basal-body rod protein FlgC
VALDISGAGMRAQRMRMQVVSQNLANEHTTGPNGPYQRQEVLLEATPIAPDPFEQALSQALGQQEESVPLQTVTVAGIQSDHSEPIKVYDPTHPHADSQGYVSLPNISMFREMADLVEASRSYEANLSAAKATQDMLIAALDLIRR